jgi:two-component system, cell cycle sensor histidine kinase and response regulator CckA
MELIGRTMSEISHSLKNILSITHSGAEVLEQHMKNGRVEAALKTWEMVRHGMDRMHSLAKAMLDYSRNETYKRHEVQINTIVSDVAGSVRVGFEKLGIALDVQLAEGLKACWLDPVGLYDVLMNLVMNSRDAMADKEAGTATLSVQTSATAGNRVLLSVTDNGKGISLELQERVFNPFFTTKGAQGNGMGLAMVQKFAKDMGGSVELISAPGKGACFNLYFSTASMDEKCDSHPLE